MLVVVTTSLAILLKLNGSAMWNILPKYVVCDLIHPYPLLLDITGEDEKKLSNLKHHMLLLQNNKKLYETN